MRHEARTRWMAVATAVMLWALAADECQAVGGRPANTAADRAVRRIIVSIPDRRLVVIENAKVIGRFDVAVGRPSSPSPVGTFTIVTRIDHPTYYAPGKVIPPGARNPLGTRWLGLSVKGFGIHGTDEPRSIGHARSHGCIRLRNHDIEALFDMVGAGDTVELHRERTTEIAQLFAAPVATSTPAVATVSLQATR
jgi:lipoprotein-anchoring transpeptidase ErfK/SrfK